jgi:hypothetical protein
MRQGGVQGVIARVGAAAEISAGRPFERFCPAIAAPARGLTGPRRFAILFVDPYRRRGQPLRETIRLATDRDQQLLDITGQVQDVARHSGMPDGVVHVCAQGATAAIILDPAVERPSPGG